MWVSDLLDAFGLISPLKDILKVSDHQFAIRGKPYLQREGPHKSHVDEILTDGYFGIPGRHTERSSVHPLSQDPSDDIVVVFQSLGLHGPFLARSITVNKHLIHCVAVTFYDLSAYRLLS